jgi:hypothetical protein
VDPAEPDELADILAESWPVQLEEPHRRRSNWSLSLAADD